MRPSRAPGIFRMGVAAGARVSRPHRAAMVARVPCLIASVVEPIAPARLGRSFRWLLSSAVISNVGDGIMLSAGPLLVASQTRDPFLVSMALLAQVLPKLLFGVVAGAVADRMDRRLIVVGVDLGRAVVLTVLAVTIASGHRRTTSARNAVSTAPASAATNTPPSATRKMPG